MKKALSFLDMKKTLDKFLIANAVKHLQRSDGVLSTLIKKYGPCTIAPSHNNLFHVLVSSIISQQLSARVAEAIKQNFLELLSAKQFTPDGILTVLPINHEVVGISRAKLEYIRKLTLAVKSGELDFPSIIKREDEEIITKLTSFTGVGRWTAEMFLIFGLGRPDILSINDAGLKKALKISYQLLELPSIEKMISISEPWKPYRTVASWYLWRILD